MLLILLRRSFVKPAALLPVSVVVDFATLF
jgi:hypothetical protein